MTELLTFDKDKAGRRIYDVRTARLPEFVNVMTMDRLVALAAEYGTPHFRSGRTHYAYIPYSGVAVACDDGAATKYAAVTALVPSVSFDTSKKPPYPLLACVKAAPSPGGVRA